MAGTITRRDLTASKLRQFAAKCHDAAMARRSLALALVLEGKTRTEAARSAGMDRQTLRDWVHRYNALGVEGLRNRANPGAPARKLTEAQESQLASWVRQGPDPERHRIVRWRLVDLRDEIAREFGVGLHERTVGKRMARLHFSRVSARPRHPEQDVAAQEAHKKTSPRLLPPAFLTTSTESR
jgi:transposase